MAETLSKELGLDLDARYTWERIRRVGVAGAVVEDRRATVEAVARWLMGQGYGGDKLTRGELADLIERKLLAPPSPGESREPGGSDGE